MTSASAATLAGPRGRPRAERDLVRQIRAYLAAHPYSTTSEIATGIRKRKSDVYAVLLSGRRVWDHSSSTRTVAEGKALDRRERSDWTGP